MDLAATTNQTFVWTVSVAAWAQILPLQTARFRMVVARGGSSVTSVLTFDSQAGAGALGTCSLDPTTNLLTMRAPFAAVRIVPPGAYVYGLTAIIPIPSAADPFVKLFAAGALTFAQAVPN